MYFFSALSFHTRAVNSGVNDLEIGLMFELLI